jgi:hypothetical protein
MFCESKVTNEQLPAHVVKASLHRSKPWASYWFDRYNNNNNNNNKECIEEGLRDKPEWKNTSYSSRGLCKDKKKINSRKQQTRMMGLSASKWHYNKGVRNTIQYHHHYTHIYRLLHNGVLNRKCQER